MLEVFYQIESQIEESKLIICEYLLLLAELSRFSLPQEKMRERTQPVAQERDKGASVVKCEPS